MQPASSLRVMALKLTDLDCHKSFNPRKYSPFRFTNSAARIVSIFILIVTVSKNLLITGQGIRDAENSQFDDFRSLIFATISLEGCFVRRIAKIAF